MAKTYKTPGVYVEEISLFPPSVAEVETAIPAFMGFTERGPKNTAKRISSILEYQLLFGSSEPEKKIVVTVQNDNVEVDFEKDKNGASVKSNNVMYYAMQLYFANGGGPCYIVSAGNFADSANASIDVYNAALDVVAKEDEPTLLVFPDAPSILSSANYYALQNNALQQCAKLGDRFAIIDVVDKGDLKTSKDDFRNTISANIEQAKYGAAYFPNLKTVLSYSVDEDSITAAVEERPVEVPAAAAATVEPTPGAAGAEPAAGRRPPRPTPSPSAQRKKFSELSNALQNQIRQKIRDSLTVDLPPAAAVAGVYASIDNARGVWKAPANVSLNYVKAPSLKITDDDQEDLNIDVTAGKSINAIRAFTGKGTKIWGARTLAGNDNEWRFVNVRRFFNMVEESVKKSTYWAVFESNDVNTWTKVRAMIENYLILKWKDGALAGAKPDDAFFVHVGLGQTMSPMDVLEGRMIVEIGLAAVRPAEFIVLKFSHKLQTS